MNGALMFTEQYISNDQMMWAHNGLAITIHAFVRNAQSRAGGSGRATREIPGLLDRGTVWDRNCIGSVLEEAMNCFAEMQRQTEEKFRTWIEKLTRLDTDEESKQQQLEPREPKLPLAGQRISPTAQAGVFVQVPDSQVLSQQSFNPYAGYQNADTALEFPATLNNNFPAAFPENGNIVEPNLNQSQS
ncbi:UNVERIFIED_CONTAM: hypothetical protein K2H54_069799 [Gekko kuhli]